VKQAVEIRLTGWPPAPTLQVLILRLPPPPRTAVANSDPEEPMKVARAGRLKVGA
jgi:hypothetical protein